MNLPLEQEAIRAKCFHPSGTFGELPSEDVESSIPERFEKIVQLYPHRLAIKAGNRALSYDELNRAANRVAHALLNRRNNKQEAVVLVMEQDVEYLITMLGVLKAGKFCVYIDPSLPPAYQQVILAETQAEVVIANASWTLADDNLRERHIDLFNVDDLSPSLSIENLELSIAPNSRANIFYTSGSTGAPKGVIQSHRYVLHKVLIDRLFIAEHDRLAQIGRLSGEVFNVLLNGASFYAWNVKKEGFVKLAAWLTSEGITAYRSIPSVFRYFCMQLQEGADLSTIRKIVLGGEAVYKRDVDLFKRYFGADCLLINKYGGGEAGPISWFVVSKETNIAGDIVPAGYSFPGKTILLGNDSSGEAVDGVGEVVVKSRYFASGYLNKPDLTQATFSACDGAGDEQIYHTGDLGSFESDGCLIYHGRKDSRIKIRGYSVDTNEIEAAIFEHKAVKEAIVAVKTIDGADTSLLAYCVPIIVNSISPSDLREFLKQKLPHYMIPSHVIILESFPHTLTGKVDRRALPVPVSLRPELDTLFEAPSSETERKLAEIWEEVLDVRPVGIHDKFFDLGGHSLSATRVVSRILEQYRFEMPLQSLFQSPTIAEMAAVIAEHQGKMLDERQLATILDELASLSDTEAERLVSEMNPTIGNK